VGNAVSRIVAFLIIIAVPAPLFCQEKDPLDVVETFCREDFNGARLSGRTSRIMDALVGWELIGPGGDSFTIVDGYQVSIVESTPDTVKVRVEYEVLGTQNATKYSPFMTTWYDSIYHERIKTPVLTLVVRFGAWHIIDPQLDPRVSPEAALEFIKELIDSGGSGSTNWDNAIEALNNLISSRPPPPIDSDRVIQM